MSQTIPCPTCGRPMDVPAYPGDGVYSRHTCPPPYVPLRPARAEDDAVRARAHHHPQPMKTPMTRRALQRAVPAHLHPAIMQWRESPSAPLAPELARAGFTRLPDVYCGIERRVLMGPQIVLKTTGYLGGRRLASDPRYRRSRTMCPTILVVEGVVAQPRGRCIGRTWGYRLRPAYVERGLRRAVRIAEEHYRIGDSHDWNFAVFPDRTVRCFDY